MTGLFGPDIPRRKSTADPSMLYRSSDPAPSRIAAEKVTRTGDAQSNRSILLAAVEANPGRTAVELAHLTGVERHEASRRLPDLRRAGLVRNGPERACSVTGGKMGTWWRTTNVED